MYRNTEDKRKYNKAWFKRNPEKRRGYDKKWRDKNPNKVKNHKLTYSGKNKERIRLKSKAYYENIIKPLRQAGSLEIKQKDKIAAQKRLAKRRKLLLKLRMDMGGKCTDCGYNKYPQILQFHHLRDKIDNVTNIPGLKKIVEEAKKCILLCPNCHAIETLGL